MKRAVIEKYMQGSPFTRLFDKVNFVIGVLLTIMTTFMVGRFPHDFYYYFHVIIIITLVSIRLFYYRSKKWHYYLFDFCYFANFLILLFLIFYPHSKFLFSVFFCYANGEFGIGIAAFRNSMIFHKIDNLTSIAIHIIPLLTSWVLKWNTIIYEKKHILNENDRYFLTLDDNESLDYNCLLYLFVYPLCLYLVWIILYSLKVFVISSRKI